MKLIFIYGPPAVGKFSVGKELVKITGYKLVHIHDFYDPLADIFTKKNYHHIIEILENHFLGVFEKGAKLRLKGMIFTYTEIGRDNFKFVKKIVKILKRHNSKVNFVKINCNVKQLYKRVINHSRKKGYKTKTKADMGWMLANKDYSKKVPGVKTFEIDNTNLSAKKVSQIIKKHFKLK